MPPETPDKREATPKRIVCPQCGSDDLTRVPRGAFTKYVLFWLSLRKYHCFKCRNKFHALV
jgi:DNA-directed RNA polymerase subunit RPC12/RpoP